MDRLERGDSPVDALIQAFRGNQAKIWTALPAIVQSYDGATNTVSVQPAVQAQVQAADGSFSWVSLPICQLVPVVFQRGGGAILTFPVKSGDECLLVLGCRCIDAWWQQGGVQPQIEIRMHDLSDGFAIIGPTSVPVAGGISPSATDVQLRSLDGSTIVGLNPASKTVTLTAPGGITINGDVSIYGNVTNNGVNIGSTHIHAGVSSGSSNTAVPH